MGVQEICQSTIWLSERGAVFLISFAIALIAALIAHQSQEEIVKTFIFAIIIPVTMLQNGIERSFSSICDLT